MTVVAATEEAAEELAAGAVVAPTVAVACGTLVAPRTL
jgi:hypothetical protein